MVNDFDRILDECIDRINKGDGIEACLDSYPDLAGQLEPLLQVVLDLKNTYSFVPSPGVKTAAKERFNRALEESRKKRELKQPLFGWLQGWSKVWATASIVLVIALISYFGIIPSLLPEEPAPQPEPGIVAPAPEPGPLPPVPAPQPEPAPEMLVALPSTDGNFIFLISDDVNAIADFVSVNVTITKISLFRNGGSGQTIEFDPELAEVDLTQVQGEKTQEIWRGDIPEGEYTAVEIEVSRVHGILKETLEEVEIKLPSNRLRLSNRFQVSAQELTAFTYDLTVVAAGSPQSGLKYILKPQASQSGAANRPAGPEAKVRPEKSDNNNKNH